MSSVGQISLGLNLNKDAMKSLAGMNGKTFNTGNAKSFSNELSGIGAKTNSLIGGFGKLAVAAAAVFGIAQLISFGKEAVKAASTAQSAFMGLQSILVAQGRSFSNAKGWIDDYIKDGLIPLQNAVTAYKNLAARGYSDEQIRSTLTALKDSAAFGRQSSYTMGEAVQSATEGLKNENSILVDNAGVTKNVAKMWDEYARSIGKTAQQLTQTEKIQAEYLGIQKETSFQIGDAAKYAQTYQGRVSGLSASWLELKTNLGSMLMTVLSPLIGMLQSAVAWVNSLVSAFMTLVSALSGISFSLFDEATGGAAGAADGIADVTEGLDNVGGAAGGAGAAAKKAMRALMGFDKLNVMPAPAESGGGGGGGGGGGKPIISNPFAKADKDIMGMSPAMQGLIDKAKELAGVFKEGFSEGLGKDFNASLDRTKEHVGGIKTSLIGIWTDPRVVSAANTWVESVALNLGRITGSAASIGQSLVENIFGGIDKWLSTDGENIKKRIANIFTINAEGWDIAGKFSVAVAEIAEVFRGNNAKGITANILGIFSGAGLGVEELMQKLGRDSLDVLTRPFIDNKDAIKTALDGVFGQINSVLAPLKKSVNETFDKIGKAYDEHVKPMLDSFASGISNTFGKWLAAYDTHIKPVVDKLVTEFGPVWEEHIQPSIDSAIGMFGRLSDAVTVMYEERIKPFIDFLITNVFPVVGPWLSVIGAIALEVLGAIGDGLKTVFDLLGALIKFLTDVFSGDWETAWTDVKDYFATTWERIRNNASEKWTEIQTTFSNVGSWFGEKFTTAKENIIGAFAFVKQWASDRKSEICAPFLMIDYWFGNIFTDSLKLIVKAFAPITGWAIARWQDIVNVFKGAGKWFGDRFREAWTTITTIFKPIANWFASRWSEITGVFRGVGTWFRDRFNEAFIAIKSIFSNLPAFFGGLWDGIRSKFVSIGTSIGQAVGGAFRGVVNGVLATAENALNSPIRAINGLIGVINALPGVSLGRLPGISLPRLAQGGFVEANTPQLAMIGDNKHEGEVVAPESKMKEMAMQAVAEMLKAIGGDTGGEREIHVHVELDGREIGLAVKKFNANEQLRSGGRYAFA